MAKSGKGKDDNPTLASNRSASHEYHLLERLEAGIALTGPEVKSCRAGKVNLKDAYARVKDGEVFLHNAHVSPYDKADRDDDDPLRPRKLLLHRREILKLQKESEQGGMTLVPTRLYLKGGLIKLEIAVAKGKKLYDKRDASRKQEAQREIERSRGVRRD
jgi:SsrA-binding protein